MSERIGGGRSSVFAAKKIGFACEVETVAKEFFQNLEISQSPEINGTVTKIDNKSNDADDPPKSVEQPDVREERESSIQMQDNAEMSSSENENDSEERGETPKSSSETGDSVYFDAPRSISSATRIENDTEQAASSRENDDVQHQEQEHSVAEHHIQSDAGVATTLQCDSQDVIAIVEKLVAAASSSSTSDETREANGIEVANEALEEPHDAVQQVSVIAKIDSEFERPPESSRQQTSSPTPSEKGRRESVIKNRQYMMEVRNTARVPSPTPSEKARREIMFRVFRPQKKIKKTTPSWQPQIDARSQHMQDQQMPSEERNKMFLPERRTREETRSESMQYERIPSEERRQFEIIENRQYLRSLSEWQNRTPERRQQTPWGWKGRWYYTGDDGEERGTFAEDAMQEWYRRGFFHSYTLVRHEKDRSEESISVGTLISWNGREMPFSMNLLCVDENELTFIHLKFAGIYTGKERWMDGPPVYQEATVAGILRALTQEREELNALKKTLSQHPAVGRNAALPPPIEVPAMPVWSIPLLYPKVLPEGAYLKEAHSRTLLEVLRTRFQGCDHKVFNIICSGFFRQTRCTFCKSKDFPAAAIMFTHISCEKHVNNLWSEGSGVTADDIEFWERIVIQCGEKKPP